MLLQFETPTTTSGTHATELAAVRTGVTHAGRGAPRTRTGAGEGEVVLTSSATAAADTIVPPTSAPPPTTEPSVAPPTTVPTSVPVTTTTAVHKPKPAPKVVATTTTTTTSAPSAAGSQDSSASPPPPSPQPASQDDVWARLAKCESNMHNDAGGPYYGYFQFSMGTWHSVGGSGAPSDHTYDEQKTLAQQLQARSGWHQWPVCSGVALRG